VGILLLAALIGVPLIEIGLFIEIGGFIGLWPTLALVVLTAAIGSWQLRAQGLATLARGRQQLDRGQLPTRELFDGFCLVIAGALLLTPGFMTDAFGLALFVPGFRDMLRRYLAGRMGAATETHVWVDGEEIRPGQGHPGRDRPGRGPGGGVIEGEYRDVSDTPDDDDDTSGDTPPGSLPR
jgi:UPF0716 protein FxsA